MGFVRNIVDALMLFFFDIKNPFLFSFKLSIIPKKFIKLCFVS